MEPVLQATSDLSSAALSVTLVCVPADILKLTLSQLRVDFYFFSPGQMVESLMVQIIEAILIQSQSSAGHL